MDELQLIRELVRGDIGPDSLTIRRSREVLESAISQEQKHSRGLWINTVSKVSRRPWWLAIPAAIVIVVAVLLTQVLPEGNSDLGMQVSAAAPLPSDSIPRLLDHAVSFGYLPAGFQLSSDSLNNKTTTPPTFVQNFRFAKGSGSTMEHLDVEIQQSFALFQFGGPESNPSRSGSTPVKIAGHPGAIYVSSLGVHKGYPCGPTVTAPSSNQFIVINWQVRRGVELSVLGYGMTRGQLLTIADRLTYQPSIADCLSGAKVISHIAACTPGATSSPPTSVPTVPPGGKTIASGTADGEPWILSALISSGNSWIQLNYGGESVGSSCATSSTLAPQFDIATSLTGRRFAVGAVPSGVTSITATSGSNKVSEPVLSKKLRGTGFFVLYLGSSKGVCDDLCQGPVTIDLYRGSAKAVSVRVAYDSEIGKFPMTGSYNFP